MIWMLTGTSCYRMIQSEPLILMSLARCQRTSDSSCRSGCLFNERKLTTVNFDQAGTKSRDNPDY